MGLLSTGDKDLAPMANNWSIVLETILPYLTVFGLCFKAIDKVFEYFGKKSKEATLELIKSYVTPQMDLIEGRLEQMKTENAEIKKLLEDIKRKQ